MHFVLFAYKEGAIIGDTYDGLHNRKSLVRSDVDRRQKRTGIERIAHSRGKNTHTPIYYALGPSQVGFSRHAHPRYPESNEICSKLLHGDLPLHMQSISLPALKPVYQIP